MKSLFPQNMMEGNSFNKRDRNPLFSSSCESLLQNRIQQEEQSSRIYHSMSMWLNNEGYSGAASLFAKYSAEENAHAGWSRDYLLAMGITPNTPALTSEPSSYQSLPQIIEKAYDQEIEITKQIKEIGQHAMKEGDHMLYTLVAQYLKEQVEEHDKMQTWIDKLKTFGTDKIALRWLDDEMGG
jgi:ferritin